MQSKVNPLERIDIFYLVNENKAVTKSELKKLLPKEEYSTYSNSFYKRKLIDLFCKNYQSPWFMQRYFTKTQEFLKSNFENCKNCFVIIGLNINDDVSLINEISGYKHHGYFIFDYNKLILLVELNEYSDNKKVEIEMKFDRKLNINYTELENTIWKKDEEMEQVLCNFYKINLDTICENEDICKNIFLFCTTCNLQYNSELEMAYRCQNHTVTEASLRRKELIKEYTSFDFLYKSVPEVLLNKRPIMVEENVWKCSYCEKKFASEAFVMKHHENKHIEEIEKSNDAINKFKMFVDRLDFNILSLAEGSCEGKPWFVRKLDDQRVVYDMNHFFSGEIIL